jgi:hypothetical protein
MKLGWVSLVVSFAFYSCVAWPITLLVNGGSKEFWWIVGGLVAIRCAYQVLEFAVSVAVWRVYGRRQTVESLVTIMRNAKFPLRVRSSDNADTYLYRIINSTDADYQAGEVTPEIRNAAAEMQSTWETIRYAHGWIAEMRMGDAIERALNIFAPENLSPPFVYPSLLWGLREAREIADLSSVPGMNSNLATALIRDRPFESERILFDYLIIQGLGHDAAAILMVRLSQHIETTKLKRIR